MKQDQGWADEMYAEARTLFTLVGDRRDYDPFAAIAGDDVPPLACQGCGRVVRWLDWPEHVREHRRTVFGY